MDPMRALRLEYLAGAVAKLPAMEAWLASGALDELRAAAHRLAGSGGFYGFEAISSAGRALEELLLAGAGPDELTAGLAALSRAVREATVE